MKSKIFLFITTLILSTVPSFADLPLTIESLVADNKRWTFESGLIYGNAKTTDTQFGQSIAVDVGNHQYLMLPTTLHTHRLQNDYLIATLGAKYGISHNTDIGLNISGSHISEDNLRHTKAMASSH